MRLPRGQVEEFPGFEVLRLAASGEGHPPLQALHHEFALGLMLLDLLTRWDDQANNPDLLGTNQGLRVGRGQRRPQGPNVHDLARLGVRNSHCSTLAPGRKAATTAVILGRSHAAVPDPRDDGPAIIPCSLLPQPGRTSRAWRAC